MTALLAQQLVVDRDTILAWFGLALLLGLVPAIIASRKGHSAVGFYIFGLFFFLPALIVALVMGSKPPAAAVWRRPVSASWNRQPVNFGITWIETGNRFMLGHATEDRYYGIWDGLEPGPALMTYPDTDQGKANAFARFVLLEPGSLVTVPEAEELPAPPPMSSR